MSCEKGEGQERLRDLFRHNLDTFFKLRQSTSSPSLNTQSYIKGFFSGTGFLFFGCLARTEKENQFC